MLWLHVFILLFTCVYLVNTISSHYTEDDEFIASAAQDIPMDILLRLNTITNMSELLNNIIDEDDEGLMLEPEDPDELTYTTKIASEKRLARAGRLQQEKVLQPQPVGCVPDTQVIKLRQSKNRRLVSFPSCIKVKQCGGCCSQELLTCRPVEIIPIKYQVLQMYYTGGEKLKIHKKDIITVEKHIKCACGCLIQEGDCNELQIYSADDCQCVCTNIEVLRSCHRQNETKVWNPNTCECQCRKVQECSTGYIFSEQSCSCEVDNNRFISRRKAIFLSYEEEQFRKNMPGKEFRKNMPRKAFRNHQPRPRQPLVKRRFIYPVH